MARVLVVDDDPVNRLALAKLLRVAGFEVAEAEQGVDAMALVNASPPDLIVTDCQMPRMDGISFTRGARAAGFSGPILMLSGQGDPIVIRIALAAGVDQYLPKPFRPAILLDAIQTAMSRPPNANAA
jgi:CheY-like chemotaxis protein